MKKSIQKKINGIIFALKIVKQNVLKAKFWISLKGKMIVQKGQELLEFLPASTFLTLAKLFRS